MKPDTSRPVGVFAWFVTTNVSGLFQRVRERLAAGDSVRPLHERVDFGYIRFL